MSVSTRAPESAPAAGDTPEAVTLAVRVWAAMLVVEVIHIVTSAVASLLDSAPLAAMVREQLAENEAVAESVGVPTDSLVTVTVWVSVGMMALLNLVIVGALVWSLRSFARRRGASTPVPATVRGAARIGGGRRLLVLFSAYFIFRALLTFFTPPAAVMGQQAVVIVDGALQIIGGVLAALGVFFATRPDTISWTGEEEQRRRLLQQLEEEERRRNDH